MTIEDGQLLIYGFKLPSLLVNLRSVYLSSWPCQHLHGDRGPGKGLGVGLKFGDSVDDMFEVQCFPSYIK